MPTQSSNILEAANTDDLYKAKMSQLYQQFLQEPIKKGNFREYVEYKDPELYVEWVAQNTPKQGVSRREFAQMITGALVAGRQVSGYTGMDFADRQLSEAYIADWFAAKIDDDFQKSNFSGWSGNILSQLIKEGKHRKTLRSTIINQGVQSRKLLEAAHVFIKGGYIDFYKTFDIIKKGSSSIVRDYPQAVSLAKIRYEKLASILNTLPPEIQEIVKNLPLNTFAKTFEGITDDICTHQEQKMKKQLAEDIQNRGWIGIPEENHYHGRYIEEVEIKAREKEGNKIIVSTIQKTRGMMSAIIKEIETWLASLEV